MAAVAVAPEAVLVEVPDPVDLVDGLWVALWEVTAVAPWVVLWVAATCIVPRWAVPCTDPRCIMVPWAVWAAVTIAPTVTEAAAAAAVPCA